REQVLGCKRRGGNGEEAGEEAHGENLTRNPSGPGTARPLPKSRRSEMGRAVPGPYMAQEGAVLPVSQTLPPAAPIRNTSATHRTRRRNSGFAAMPAPTVIAATWALRPR